MRIGWVGFHQEGVPALRGVLDAGFRVVAVITLDTHSAEQRSGAVDYGPICRESGVPLHRVGNVNSDSAVELLAGLDLDLLIVVGWSQILGSRALRTARLGAIGSHASWLPKDRGRAPVNWAIIRGETQTGNTLMWLAEGVDSGEIIDQTVIPITDFDSCASIYDAVASSNRNMILGLLASLARGVRPGVGQLVTDEPLLPGRSPEDGAIDWSGSARSVYDLVRAVTRPYPGAFGYLDGRRVTVWKSALLPFEGAVGAPGAVLGPVVSFIDSACGQLVACGTGAVLLMEVESDEGHLLAGRALAELPWQEKLWDAGKQGAEA